MIRSSDGRMVRVGGETRYSGGTDPTAIPIRTYGPGHAGVEVNSTTALQVDSVFTSMRVISNAIIKMGDPRAYTLALDPQNEPYRQWLRVQPAVLSSTFGNLFQFDGITRTVSSMALLGEAFWFTLTRDYLQRPTAVEVLNPVFVRADPKNPGDWLYGNGSQSASLKGEDVTHIPFLTLPGADRGLSGIEYAGVSLALAIAAMEYGQRWFAQGASPSYLLSTDMKLGTDEVKRIAERFAVEHAGLENAHLPLVVDSGLKVQKIQSTPDEAQYLATLQYARSCIGAWFGLPPHLIGGDDGRGNVWGKTIEEQSLQFSDYTLSGYIVRLNEAFGSLLPRNTFAALDERAIIRANSADTAAEILALRTSGVETKNEIRVGRLRKAPLPGGDELTDPLNSNASPGVGSVFAEEVQDETGEPAPSNPTNVGAA